MTDGPKKSPVSSGASDEGVAQWRGGRPVGDDDGGFAQRADGGVGVESQDALLASIEARLTEEVCRLIAALRQFSSRAQLVGKEIPDRTHFGKSVTSLLALIALQYADSLGKSLDRPILFDDGAEYLRKFGLRLEDSIREVTLDGRRFLAVALVDELANEAGSAGEASKQ